MIFMPQVRRASAGGGDPPAGDQYWANVVLLSGFEGSDGSTSFTDESATAHALTAVGNAQIDTADKMFGASSYLGDGNGDYITVGNPNHFTDFDFGSGDLTVECWLKTSSASLDRVLDRDGGASNTRFYLGFGSTGLARWMAGGTIIVTAGPDLRDSAWHHVAASRNGSTTRLFVDGTEVGSGTSVDIQNGSGEVYIGSNATSPGTLSFPGWIDELRVTKGVGRYTANFTPPTAAFPRE